MTEPMCPLEATVLEAARRDEWDADLRAHMSECPVCTETERVTTWMNAAATALGCGEQPPDPTYIWLKAQIERGQRDAARSSRKGLISQALVGFVLTVAGVATVLEIWQRVSATASEAQAWVLMALAERTAAEIAIIGSAWLALPLVLVATFLIVERPQN